MLQFHYRSTMAYCLCDTRLNFVSLSMCMRLHILTFFLLTSITCYKLLAFCLSPVLGLKDWFQPSKGSKHVCDHAWERIDSRHLFLWTWTITIASALMQTTLCVGLLTGILTVCLVQLQALLSDCYGRTLQLQHILANFCKLSDVICKYHFF